MFRPKVFVNKNTFQLSRILPTLECVNAFFRRGVVRSLSHGALGGSFPMMHCAGIAGVLYNGGAGLGPCKERGRA